MPLLVKVSTSPAKSCGYPWLLILSHIPAMWCASTHFFSWVRPKTQLSNHGFRVQYKQQHPVLVVSHFFIHFLCLNVESQDISIKEVTYAAV
ncbi:hypothetical protein AMTRI_Chr04g251980 [Amborella trichopoda]